MWQELKPFFRTIAYLVSIHLTCLFFSTLCRGLMLVVNGPDGGIEWDLALRAMLIGMKFDNLIVSYISSLPMIIVPVFALITMHNDDFAQRI